MFANNRLSVVLHSSNSISDFARLCTNEAPKAAVALYDNLMDPEYGHSYDGTKSPFMYAVKDQLTGSFFDWMKRFVRVFLRIHAFQGFNFYSAGTCPSL